MLLLLHDDDDAEDDDEDDDEEEDDDDLLLLLLPVPIRAHPNPMQNLFAINFPILSLSFSCLQEEERCAGLYL